MFALHFAQTAPNHQNKAKACAHDSEQEEEGRRGGGGWRVDARGGERRRWPGDARPRLTPRNRRFERRKERLCAHGAVKRGTCGRLQTGNGRLSPSLQNKAILTTDLPPQPPPQQPLRCFRNRRIFVLVHPTLAYCFLNDQHHRQ